MIWVIDASVAVRWYLEDEAHDYADEVLKAVQQKEELTTLCPHCARGVSLDFRDCPYCRRPLVPTCNSCERIVQPDWVVCPYCRHDLHRKARIIHLVSRIYFLTIFSFFPICTWI